MDLWTTWYQGYSDRVVKLVTIVTDRWVDPASGFEHRIVEAKLARVSGVLFGV